MHEQHGHDTPCHHHRHKAHEPRPGKGVSVRWFAIQTLIAGFLALCWLLVRSGTKPSRFVYPCQQAAFSTATLAFGAPLVTAVIATRQGVAERLFTPRGMIVAVLGLIAVLSVWGMFDRTAAYQGPMLDAPADYRAEIFNKRNCAQDPEGDHFPCLDDLFEIMGAHDLKFHQSSTASLTAGPAGVVGADDVVILKINYQWDQRGGTNTDLLRGLIRRIMDHPDEFTGEIVVCENAQFNAGHGFDRANNNAQDHSLSPRDVVVGYQTQGYKISTYAWGDIRYNSVSEFSDGDNNDGYIIYPYDSLLGGRVSYPKFTTSHGTRISLKHGVWNGEAYDRARLKFINLPVLKSHHATYGATAMVKNYMGVVTRELSTNSHGAIHNGILGAAMGEFQPADLNILDAIWVNANPNTGPSTSYSGATRLDTLVATRDPVAGDLWAVKTLLIPAFAANGYSPPWPNPSADPGNESSAFRQYLDHSMDYMLAAGYSVTNDMAKMDITSKAPPGEASDPGGGGQPFTIARQVGGYDLAWSAPVRGGAASEYSLYAVPLDGSGVAVPECEATLGNATWATLATLPAGHGFIVVGRNSIGDGSFGSSSRGIERPSPLEVEVCP